jgi:hypothetical protein
MTALLGLHISSTENIYNSDMPYSFRTTQGYRYLHKYSTYPFRGVKRYSISYVIFDGVLLYRWLIYYNSYIWVAW